MKRIMKKVLSLVLAMVMVMLPATTIAAENNVVTLWEGDYVFGEDDLYTYICEEEENAYDGLIYTAPASGAITIQVEPKEGTETPGASVAVVDNSTWDRVLDKAANGASSYKVYVTEGTEYVIKIATYDCTIEEHPLWGPTEIGPCTGELTYKVTFETGATPAPGEVMDNPIVVDNGGTVSVAAGSTVWYAVEGDVYTPYYVNVTSEAHAFEVYSDYDWSTAQAVNGAVKPIFTCNGEGMVVFSLTNASDSVKSYEIETEEALGLWNNPYMIYGDGEYTATLVEEDGRSIGCNYLWTADAPGVLTITMTCDEWYYSFVNGHYSNGDGEWQYDPETGTEEFVVLGTFPSESVQVEAGDEVEFMVNSYDEEDDSNPIDATVTFKLTFVPGAVLEDDGSLNGPVDEINKTYKNTVTPEKFTLTLGEGDVIKNVNVLDGVIEKAVLGADGYYHLNTADGPVLLVSIGSKAPYNASLAGAAGENRIYVSEYKDGTLVKRTDYNKAVSAYAKCMDTTRGLYPLTEDLMTVYKEYGAFQNWYTNKVIDGTKYATSLFNTTDNETGVITYKEGDENAWMFACCYVETAEDVTVLEGKDSTWTIGSTEAAKVRFDAEFDMFKAVRVDGKVVDPANYEVKEGSIIVALKADYLKTLGAGEHTLSVELLNTQIVSTKLTVANPAPVTDPTPEKAPVEAPKTGDNTNYALWIAVLGLGVVAIAGSVVMKKREF